MRRLRIGKMGNRRHLLMPKNIEKALPKLYSTEKVEPRDKRVIVKFFSPYSQYTFYCVEGEREPDNDNDIRMFGLVVNEYGQEWGYSSFNELNTCYRGSLPLIERDCWHGKPGERTIGQCVKNLEA